jgi:hypothetical protein
VLCGNNGPATLSSRCDGGCMNRWWPRRTTAAAHEQLRAGPERVAPLEVAARACCCPARPVVTVVIPPTASRPHPVDLLMCGHHFRITQAALRAAGAAVYDRTGLLIMAGTKAAAPRAKPGPLARMAPGHRS